MNNELYQLFIDSSGICINSREIKEGVLFVCIKGENFDGNTFANEALESGAKHVIVDNEDYFQNNGKMSLVNDSISFLQDLAKFHRNQFNIPIIGITGSNGKTTTKELINVVLQKKYKVLSTIGNLNNHIGVPLTLLRLSSTHEIAIIEMGANKFKDIEELCNIASPTHGIITNIGKAHLEGFLNFEGVLKTKKELYDSISMRNGIVITNSDDAILKNILPSNTTNFSYGIKDSNLIQGELIGLNPFIQMRWQSNNEQSPIVNAKMIGEYNFYNYLAAIAFGKLFNVASSLINDAIEEYTPENNRSQVKLTSHNTLILDCYNANPTSMKSALESFAKNETTLSKIAILGEMKELGEDTLLEHQSIISLAEELALRLILVGKLFNSFDGKSIVKKFDDTEGCANYLRTNKINQHMILLKGSRSVGLEKLENDL